MKKFMIIYYAPVDAMMQTANATTEEQAKGMEGWKIWAQKCGDKLLDLGNPLMNGQQLTHDGKSKESDKNVTGYSILGAENIEEAKELLKGHPHLAWNCACSIELYEVMPIPGM